MAQVRRILLRLPKALSASRAVVTQDPEALLAGLGGQVTPERNLQLLSIARERLPALRAEIEFWTLLLAGLDGSDSPPATPARTSKMARTRKPSAH
jgi:hypothetical protein